MRAKKLFRVAGFLLLPAITGGGVRAEEARSVTGTERMAQRLKRIVHHTDLETNFYMNAERAKYYRGLLKPGLDVRTVLKVRIRLAEELLRAGRSAESVREIEGLREMIRDRGILLAPWYETQLESLSAIAYLRLGEQENCVQHHGIESCVLPIRGAGIHGNQRGSRGAIRELTAVLNKNQNDLISRWLLNLAYMTVGEYPKGVSRKWLIPEESFRSEYDAGQFTDIAPAAGVDSEGLSGGSILEDFNGDGWLDVMASSSGLLDQLRYFENQGDGTFIERTEQAGLRGEVGGLNIIHADYNNDGHPDVFVLRGAWLGPQGRFPNSLLRNNGDGTFEDVTEAAGLLSFHPTQTAAWADFDNDGWLDLFVGNESSRQEAHPCELYRNNADGTFTDVAAETGVADLGFVKGVAWGDYDNDDRPDLYVSRKGQPNLLFRNESGGEEPGGWRFTDVTEKAGVSEPIESFPAWFWDYDNDGWLDLLVAGYHTSSLGDIAALYLGEAEGAEKPRLYRNNGDGSFADVTHSAGLDRVILVMGANYGDLDNDGFLDCYFGTGDVDFRTLLPNRMFRNGNGARFQDVTTSGRFGHLQKGHGISFGDVDGDGDQDIYAVMGGAYAGDVFRNVLFRNPGHGNHWIKLTLEGDASNRFGLGARIRVRVKSSRGTREIHRHVSSGGSFGDSPLRQEIGLGQAESVVELQVRWPTTGKVQRFRDVALDRSFLVREDNPDLIERQVRGI